MIIRKIFVTLLVISTAFFVSSCINELGITFPSINNSKRKKKIAPSYNFNSALFEYRQRFGHWPNSEMDFSSYHAEVVREIYFQGFETWRLSRFSQDTLFLYLTHQPLHDGAHVGIVPIPHGKIYLVSQYTFLDRSVITKVLNKRKYIRETGL